MNSIQTLHDFWSCHESVTVDFVDRSDRPVNDMNYPLDTKVLKVVRVAEEQYIVTLDCSASESPESTAFLSNWRRVTETYFRQIGTYTPKDVEELVKQHVQAKIEGYEIEAEIVDVVVAGSRCRGLEQDGADLDVVVELTTKEREDDLFNAFHEDELSIEGIRIDINPITMQCTGSIASYLSKAEAYLKGKKDNAQYIQRIAEGLCNYNYLRDMQEGGNAIKELIHLFDEISIRPLWTPEDYIKMYEDNFYTYQTWDALIESEEEQTDGLSEDECRALIGSGIWQLPCGWYVQYV